MYRGEKVILRALTSADAEAYARWLNDMDAAMNARGDGCMPLSPEEGRDYVARNAWNTFAIERISDGKLIGNCSYFDVDHQSRACRVAILIGDAEDRGKGYGKDAMLTLLKFLFHHRNMYRVALEVYEYNKPAAALYEKLGFVRECVYRRQAYAMGRYWDEYGYGMLRREFDEKYGDR